MEEDEDMTPFWLQATTSSTVGRIRRRSSSFLLNSGVLLIILLVIAAAFIFIIIPSFLSFTSQIFRPHLVKKSWDTLNLVLVLFAIVCGFLSQNNTSNETPRSASSPTASPSFVQKPSFESLTPRRGWFSNNNSTNGGLNRLRSFSSYPDLRAEEASWMTSESDHPPWRFYDDTRLYNYRYSSLKDQPFNQFKPEEKLRDQREGVVEEVVKRVDDDISGTTTTVVEAEKKVVYTPPPAPPLSQSPPAPPLPKVVRRATAYQKVAKRSTGESTGKVDEDLGRVNRFTSSPPPPPRPSSPPPQMDDRESRNEKKRGATSATKDFLTSLRRNKKKKQRQKSVENLDIFFNYESSYPFPPPPPSQPPPPPPPPPPPNFIQNLFSQKKRKTKKIHSVPPPPPPPPPPQKTQLYSSSASKPKLISQNVTKTLPSTTHKPPLPVKIKSHNNVEETVSSGNESPLMGSIPPPPPLPPFNMPVWKFEVVERDFVRLKSHNDSDFDEANAEESSSPSEAADLATSSPLFCLSPDVNTKADKFIARFRAGLELERINSAKERGKSNLSPS